ncbi:hypothetical protein B0H11DRAFT_1153764 [Mycena galericulata]|nr:hypothetical protein B0H11DRAFT_1326436 [Mycena galericulata]KAJ7485208.1 hypothetical protein B0H11DRAFT_1153764 [Mycena galericulata]
MVAKFMCHRYCRRRRRSIAIIALLLNTYLGRNTGLRRDTDTDAVDYSDAVEIRGSIDKSHFSVNQEIASIVLLDGTVRTMLLAFIRSCRSASASMPEILPHPIHFLLTRMVRVSSSDTRHPWPSPASPAQTP